jgi:type VI secretion system protein ImpA
MSEAQADEGPVTQWLQPLPDESAPCGPDLETDNRFLELTLAGAGKPETQFSKAEPPDWRAVREIAEDLMTRTRDLRVAMFWVRAGLRLEGFTSLARGMKLLAGLVDNLWDHLHPLPDPEDNDPYARVNTLTLLRENEGLLGDLRASFLVRDRALGELTVRQLEVARGLATPIAGETDVGAAVVTPMLEAACGRDPAMRETAVAIAETARHLGQQVTEKLGSSVAPDLKPLQKLLDAVVAAMPAPVQEGEEGEGGEAGEGSAAGEGGGARRGLSGGVNSRQEAIRAIELACQYLERHEPANPAALFLRRARYLIDQNFLQLVQQLAPGALAEVANLVGVDPESVTPPGST